MCFEIADEVTSEAAVNAGRCSESRRCSYSMTRVPRAGCLVLLVASLEACGLFDSDPPAGRFQVIWHSPVSAWAHGTPTIAGDKVIASFEDQRLRAFRLSDGRQVWQSDVAGRNLFPLEVHASRDSVAVVTSSTSVFGFSITDGK